MMHHRSRAVRKPSRTACGPTRMRGSARYSSSSIPSARPRSTLLGRCWRRSTAVGDCDPKAIVRKGYDRISFEYRDDAGRGPANDQRLGRPDYEVWLAELMPLLQV